MKIIVGHSNMDLDCLGSMVLVRRLFPDHVPVRSHLIHPVARNLYNLYQNHLNFLSAAELKGRTIERLVVVDTRSLDRILEFYRHVDGAEVETFVYDHHDQDTSDIPRAQVRSALVGANTSLVGTELIERGISIGPEDATIALSGIYADTGNFTHENVRNADFQVAAYCLENGASLALVKSFLNPLQQDYQITLFHEILNRLVFKNFSGHRILLSYFEIDKNISGLAAVVEKVFEVESPDAIFSVFFFHKTSQALIIARSQSRDINVATLLKPFGGNGHAAAASASVKHVESGRTYARLETHLADTLKPAMTAAELMSSHPYTINENQNLIEASIFLERVNHTGVPVVNDANDLVGFLTLRDIMKGRRAEQMQAPVKAYMTRKVVTGAPQTTIREVEELLFKNNIGHLPILENGRVAGILTRSDYLSYKVSL